MLRLCNGCVYTPHHISKTYIEIPVYFKAILCETLIYLIFHCYIQFG